MEFWVQYIRVKKVVKVKLKILIYMPKQKSNNKQPERADIKETIKKLLAEHIGVEPDDIHDTDSFMDDLHMGATDLADFMEALDGNEIETSSLDLSSLETVKNLIESISSNEPIE
jgi:acyl carrier protein